MFGGLQNNSVPGKLALASRIEGLSRLVQGVSGLAVACGVTIGCGEMLVWVAGGVEIPSDLVQPANRINNRTYCRTDLSITITAS